MRPARSATALAFAVLLACHEGEGLAGIGVAGPRSGGIVFVKEVGGQADLARARLADGAVAVVTPTPEREERWPYWSDVARRVVFQFRPYGPRFQTDLAFWDPESGEEEVLASTPIRDEGWPSWSPVAARLAYAFKQPRRESGIVLYDLATKRSEVLASIKIPGLFLRPEFSPDGRRLVAQRRPTRNPPADLWLLEAGQPPRRLTSEPAETDSKARFMPDGRTLLFNRHLGEEGPRDLFLLDLETGSERRFASLPMADDHSAWPSPVRDEIAFISDRDGSHDVFLVDVTDGVPRNITRSPGIDEGVPLWSPEGDRLVVLRRPPSGPGRRPSAHEHRLAVIDRDGRTLFETQGMMADWMPAWPEGEGR
jgi:Tol biopolymer transport system component